MFSKKVIAQFETKYLQGIPCGWQQSGHSFGLVGHAQVELGGMKSNVTNSFTMRSFLPQLITLNYLNNIILCSIYLLLSLLSCMYSGVKSDSDDIAVCLQSYLCSSNTRWITSGLLITKGTPF